MTTPEITQNFAPYKLLGTRFSLALNDVEAELPGAIKALAGQGCDLTKVAEALREVEEEQRKAKEAEAIKAKFKAAAEAYIDDEKRKTPRRFVVSYANDEIIKVAEGVEFGNGKLYINGSRYPEHGLKESMPIYKKSLENNGFTSHIEYLD